MASKKSLTEAGMAATSKFFTVAQEEKQAQEPKKLVIERTEKPQEEPKRLVVGKSTSDEEKPVKTANTKPQKRVFSFRADEDLVKKWRTYAAACPGMKVDDLGALALQEYIESHPLTGAAKKFYEDTLKTL